LRHWGSLSMDMAENTIDASAYVTKIVRHPPSILELVPSPRSRAMVEQGNRATMEVVEFERTSLRKEGGRGLYGDEEGGL